MKKVLLTVLLILNLIGCKTTSSSSNSTNQLSNFELECQEAYYDDTISFISVSNQKSAKSAIKFIDRGCLNVWDKIKYPSTYSSSDSFSKNDMVESLLGYLNKNNLLNEAHHILTQTPNLEISQLALGAYYEDKDIKKSYENYLKSAIKDNCVAQLRLSESYFFGIFTEINKTKSYFWYSQSERSRGILRGKDTFTLPPYVEDKIFENSLDSSNNIPDHFKIAKIHYPYNHISCHFNIPYMPTILFTDENAIQKIKEVIFHNWDIGQHPPKELDNIVWSDNISNKQIAKQEKKSEIESTNNIKINNLKKITLKIQTNNEILSKTELFEKLNSSIYSIISAKSQTDLNLGYIYSGSAIAIDDKTILTNCHIIENKPIYMLMIDNNPIELKLIMSDFNKDICFLNANYKLNPVINFKFFDNINIGEEVIAIGNPSGLEKSISEGIISGKRNINDVITLQTNAEISPGSSGGGLFDLKGNLIGITSSGLTGEGLNFAISIDEFLNR